MKRIAIIGSPSIGTSTFIRKALAARATERVELIKKDTPKDTFQKPFFLESIQHEPLALVNMRKENKSKYHK